MRSKLKSLITLAALLIIVCAYTDAKAKTANTECTISGSAITASIQSSGIKQVYDDLSKPESWPKVLSCVETGEPDWIRVANSFGRDAADYRKKQQLAEALGVALVSNARDVLEITEHEYSLGLTLKQICSLPNPGDVRFDTYGKAITEITRREGALAGVKDDALRDDIATCDSQLEQAKKEVAAILQSRPAATCALSSSDISNEIQRDGAHSAYTHLIRAGHWDDLITCVGTGDSAWFKIDGLLEPVSDGHYGEELITALGVAFGNRPKDVLEIINHEPRIQGGVDAICSAPDIDDARYSRYELAMKEIERRESLLDRITDKELANDVAECRSDFENAKKWMAHVFNGDPYQEP